LYIWPCKTVFYTIDYIINRVKFKIKDVMTDKIDELLETSLTAVKIDKF
jgi:hypothetical protein